jgi:hypothetical protein
MLCLGKIVDSLVLTETNIFFEPDSGSTVINTESITSGILTA